MVAPGILNSDWLRGSGKTIKGADFGHFSSFGTGTPKKTLEEGWNLKKNLEIEEILFVLLQPLPAPFNRYLQPFQLLPAPFNRSGYGATLWQTF